MPMKSWLNLRASFRARAITFLARSLLRSNMSAPLSIFYFSPRAIFAISSCESARAWSAKSFIEAARNSFPE